MKFKLYSIKFNSTKKYWCDFVCLCAPEKTAFVKSMLLVVAERK